MQTSGVSYLIHYLDDYLTMGPPLSSVCKDNLDIFTRLCKDLGVPLACEKLEGPSTSLTFLGITLYTNHMEIRLPEDKLSRIQIMLKTWLPRKKAIKRQILSLVGTLQHASKWSGLAGHLSHACTQQQLNFTRCITSPG